MRTFGVVLALAVTVAMLLVPGRALAQELNRVDEQFLVAAHQANLAEIAAGKLAQQKAGSSDVREHGAVFIRDHTALDADVQRVARALGVELPDAPSAEQRRQLDAVAANEGDAFDRAWIGQQLLAHRASLALGERELATGQNRDVQGLARNAAPVINKHLHMLRTSAQARGIPSGIAAGEGGSSQSTAPLWVLLGGLALVAGGVLALRRRGA
jgi:putative membrane protein